MSSSTSTEAIIAALYTVLAATKEEIERLRAILIEDTIATCSECGREGFSKESQCESCIAAVDERIAVHAALQESQEP